MSTEDRPTLLLVDDETLLRERLAKAFDARGFEVLAAADVEEALTLARARVPELAVVDLRMPGRSGLDLLRELKALDEHTRVVILTGYGSIATAVEATRAGATAYVPKPADADEILAAFGKGTDFPHATQSFETPTLARAEWEHIQRVLADSQGNISEAARRLGLHRQSLQRKIRKFAPK